MADVAADAAGRRTAGQSHGRSDAATIGVGAKVLSLLTLNLGLLALRPFGLPGISFSSHLDERLAAAPDGLRATGADIIALQEVYASTHIRFLRETLSRCYPHVSAPRNLRSMLGSGLMFLSRYPIAHAEFVPWRGAPAIESTVSQKGCLCVVVELPGFGLVRLINVHLTVGGALRHPQVREGRRRRLAEIEQVIALGDRSDRVPAILIGDFNCSPTVSPDIYKRIVASGFIDAFAALAKPDEARRAVTWDCTNPLNAGGRYRNEPSQRIDHIFVPASLYKRCVPILGTIELTRSTVAVGVARAVPLSDHYGLSVRFALNAG